MFGTKLRSWMETHIVRSRKKQQKKESKGKQETVGSRATNGCSRDGKSPDKAHLEIKHANVQARRQAVRAAPGAVQTSMSLVPSTNLSSPESAYSTGYSTDGTSPGTSIPPEYYINLRTGTHYFQASATTADSVRSVLSPRSPRNRKEDLLRRKTKESEHTFRESSTEEDIIGKICNNVQSIPQKSTPKSLCKVAHPMNSSFHRRTESYDDNQRHCASFYGKCNQQVTYERADTAVTAVSFQCTSPYLSNVSPRPRTRIRTNPWLGGTAATVVTAATFQSHTTAYSSGKNYNSQGETSSTVDSSSTLSSSGCKERLTGDETRTSVTSRSKEKANYYGHRQCAVSSPNPFLYARCGDTPQQRSSSSSGSSSVASEDNHHGNTSDFSEDDVTLNEMLGKFDESYVYEKETDILSDSDPTDCEDQPDYNDEQCDKRIRGGCEQREDIDFIDTGSLAELYQSDCERPSNKIQNNGHCTYHHLNGAGLTPDMSRKTSHVRRPTAKEGTSSAANRRFHRSYSHRCDDVTSSAELLPPRRNRTKEHDKTSLESLRKVELARCSFKNSPELDKRVTGTPGKHLNLNRVLMERLISNQRNGTRSADGTPISLRRQISQPDCNGKFIQNHYISKLINSNSSIKDEQNKCSGRENAQIVDNSKKCSQSLTVSQSPSRLTSPLKASLLNGLNNIDKEGDMKYRCLMKEAEHMFEEIVVKTGRCDYLSPKVEKRPVYTAFQSPLANRCDNTKPKIDVNTREAQMVINCHNSCENSPIHNRNGRVVNDDGLFRAISKTLERIIVRNSDLKKDENIDETKLSRLLPPIPALHNQSPLASNKYCKSDLVSRGAETSSISVYLPDNENYYSRIPDTDCNENMKQPNHRFWTRPEESGQSVNQYSGYFKRPPVENSAQSLRQNFTENIYTEIGPPTSSKSFIRAGPFRTPIIERRNVSSSPNRIRHMNSVWPHPVENRPQASSVLFDRKPPLDYKGRPTMVAFRSFDLGNNSTDIWYCPQSEPVKRKVYKYSATFSKLQKSIMRKNPRHQVTNASTSANRGVEGGGSSLKEKVTQLRRERLQVEARVRDAQCHIERLKLSNAIETG